MDILEIKSVLKSTYPFLTTNDIEQFLKICSYRKLKNKEILIRKGEFSQTLFFILSGMMRGYFNNQKGEEINVFLRPEHTVSGVPDSLFANKSTKYSFESILETELLLFELKDLEALSLKLPNISKLYLAGLQENIQTLIFRVESLVDKMPEERYQDLLERSPQFFQKAFNKHIANYLGITPVSLSRIIKRKKDPKTSSKGDE